MAYRPSMRGKRAVIPVSINMFPMMNLMVVLVPLLLSTATAIKIGMIELNLPQASGGPISDVAVPKETTPNLDLTVTIVEAGFILSSSRAVLDGMDGDGPTIPLLPDGSFDFQQLHELLVEIKTKIQSSEYDTRRIILQAEPDINYQTIIQTMDAARLYNNQGYEAELFPEVTISAGII